MLKTSFQTVQRANISPNSFRATKGSLPLSQQPTIPSYCETGERSFCRHTAKPRHNASPLYRYSSNLTSHPWKVCEQKCLLCSISICHHPRYTAIPYTDINFGEQTVVLYQGLPVHYDFKIDFNNILSPPPNSPSGLLACGIQTKSSVFVSKGL